MFVSVKFFLLCLSALSEGYSELYVDAAIRLPSGHFEFFFGPYSQVYNPSTGLSETPVLTKNRYPFLPRNGTLDSALVIPQEYGGPAFFLIQGDNYFSVDPVTGSYSTDARCLHCDWDLPLPTGISGASLNPLTGEMFFFVGEFAHVVDVRSLSRKDTVTTNQAFIGLPRKIKGVLDITPLAISVFFYKHRYFIWDWNSRRVRSGDIHYAFPGVGLSPELYNIYNQNNKNINKIGLIFDTTGGPVVSANRGGLNISSRVDEKCQATSSISCSQCIFQSCSWSFLRARCEVSPLSDLANGDATRNCTLVNSLSNNSGSSDGSSSSGGSSSSSFEELDFDRSCTYQLKLTRGEDVTIATTDGDVLLSHARNSSQFTVKPGKQLSISVPSTNTNVIYQILDLTSKTFYRSNGNSSTCGVLPRVTHCGGCEQISLKDECSLSAHCTWKLTFQPFSASCVSSPWKTIDAALFWQNNTVVFFSVDQFKEYDLSGNPLASGTLGQSRWAGIPMGVDGAFTADGEVYVFKGSQYWKFDPKTNAVGPVRPIGAGFSGVPVQVHSAMNDLSSQAVYFFNGDQGYHVPFQAGGLRVAEPPFQIEDQWYCVPDNVEATFAAIDTYYFFQGENFWEIVNNTCTKRYINNRFKNLLVTPSPLVPTPAVSLSTNMPTSALPPSAARSNVTKPYLPPSPAPPPIISLLASTTASSSSFISSSSSSLAVGKAGGKKGKNVPTSTPSSSPSSSSSSLPSPPPLSSRTRPPLPPPNIIAVSSPPPTQNPSSPPTKNASSFVSPPLARGKRSNSSSAPSSFTSSAPTSSPSSFAPSSFAPSSSPSTSPSTSPPSLALSSISSTSRSSVSTSSLSSPSSLPSSKLPWSLPSPVDAATEWSNAVYLFSGNEYKQFSLMGKYEETGLIAEGWPGINMSNYDASFHSGTSDYFFKNKVCQLWQQGVNGVQTVKWDAAIPFPIDAALESSNGHVLFFKDTNFFEADVSNRSLISKGQIAQRFPGVTQRVLAAFQLNSTTVFLLAGQQWMMFGDNITRTGNLSLVGGLVRGTCGMNQDQQSCTAPCQWCNAQSICATSRNCAKAFQESRWFGASSTS